MIVVLKPNRDDREIEKFVDKLKKNYKVDVHRWKEGTVSILGLVGDTSLIPLDDIQSQEPVLHVSRIKETYKQTNRKLHPDNTVIDINANCRFGGGQLHLIAGPCSIESKEQAFGIAKQVKEAGCSCLRGGVFKPRTSPYSFQGLGKEGLQILQLIKEEMDLPIITEITAPWQLPFFENVDMIQVGARNMQNYELLKELGKTPQPILLKRGFCNTIEELLMSAEYIMANGNSRVLLCERGIRTFETSTRYTLDISAVPILKKLSHLPVVVDPSHAGGTSWMIEPLSLACVAAGADALMIEVHNCPSTALSDGPQALTPDEFRQLARKVFSVQETLKSAISSH